MTGQSHSGCYFHPRSETDLKRCPFCGSSAELIDAPEAQNKGSVVVVCRSCNASGPCVFGVKEDPKPHAIAAWNRRV